MKKINIDIEFAKRVLFSILFISAFVIALDLYVPVKMMISGDKLLVSEILSHINYRHNFPFILIGSIIIGLFSGEPNEENRKK